MIDLVVVVRTFCAAVRLPACRGICALRTESGTCPRTGTRAGGFGVCEVRSASVDRCPIAFLFWGLGLPSESFGLLALVSLDSPRQAKESPGSGRGRTCWSSGTTSTSAAVHLQVSKLSPAAELASPQGEHPFNPWKQCLTIETRFARAIRKDRERRP